MHMTVYDLCLHTTKVKGKMYVEVYKCHLIIIALIILLSDTVN